MRKNVILFLILWVILLVVSSCAGTENTTNEASDDTQCLSEEKNGENKTLPLTEGKTEESITLDKTTEIQETQEETLEAPWNQDGAKQPSDYTWEEFETLSGPHQMMFQKTFDSFEDFEKWMVEAMSQECPWNHEGAKQPREYSWEEFEALSPDHQMMFQNSFESIDEFDKWMQDAYKEAQKSTYPWEKDGAKKPSEYTWEEFEALSPELQIAFQYCFESSDGFDKWLTANEPRV